MEKVIDFIIHKSENWELIDEQEKVWFRYGLEKRLITLGVGVPFAALAVWLADLWTATGFFVSFALLRRKINGYHASTPLRCFCSSIMLELLFLGILHPIFRELGFCLPLIASSVVIFLFAPYIPPQIQLSIKEIRRCKISARFCCLMLLIVSAISFITGLERLVAGISLGNAMAALLLCFAYILNWRKKHENNKRNSKKSPGQRSKANDRIRCA